MTADCARRIARGHWAEDEALNRCTAPIGPRNTWSNLAYVIVGLLIATDGTDASALMGSFLAILGVGSGMYHAYKTRWANALDHLGMHMVFGGLVAFGVTGDSSAALPAMLAGGVATSFILTYWVRLSLDTLMGIDLAACLALAWWHGDLRLALASMAVFVVAYVIWQLDKRKSPLVGLWGHAGWHVLTAVAIWLMYVALGHRP